MDGAPGVSDESAEKQLQIHPLRCGMTNKSKNNSNGKTTSCGRSL
jgi:hypothetical protein